MKISKINPKYSLPSTDRLHFVFFFSFQISFIERSDQISMIDDLAFDMYQDPEIASIIRNLDRKKQECVHGKKGKGMNNAYTIKSFEFLRIRFNQF